MRYRLRTLLILVTLCPGFLDRRHKVSHGLPLAGFANTASIIFVIQCS